MALFISWACGRKRARVEAVWLCQFSVLGSCKVLLMEEYDKGEAVVGGILRSNAMGAKI